MGKNVNTFILGKPRGNLVQVLDAVEILGKLLAVFQKLFRRRPMAQEIF